MRAGHRRLGTRLGSFFVAAAAALTIFLAMGVVLETFSSLGGVQLTQAEGKAKPKDKCKPKDKDGNDTDNDNGSGSGQGNKKPCPTPTPSPSPTCTPGGYGVPPVCPSLPPVAGGGPSRGATDGVPGTVLGGTTVAQGGPSTTEGAGTGSTTTGSTTVNDTKAKGKGAGSVAGGEPGSGSSPKTRVLGETLHRPEASSDDRAAGAGASDEGMRFLGLSVPLDGTAFALTTLLSVAVIGLFLFLLIKRRRRTN